MNLKKLYEYQETIVHLVAHDLKSPINTITSLTGLLQKNLQKLPAEGAGEKQEQNLLFLRMISDTCQKANATIRDLLLIGDFKSNHDFEQTDPKGLLESQLAILSMDARKREYVSRLMHRRKPCTLR